MEYVYNILFVYMVIQVGQVNESLKYHTFIFFCNAGSHIGQILLCAFFLMIVICSKMKCIGLKRVPVGLLLKGTAKIVCLYIT